MQIKPSNSVFEKKGVSKSNKGVTQSDVFRGSQTQQTLGHPGQISSELQKIPHHGRNANVISDMIFF